MARERFDTVKQLNAMPWSAVVYDQDGMVWQLRPLSRWATPGVAGAFPVDDVELPAYLLDDGL